MAGAETSVARRAAHLAVFDATTFLARGIKEQLVERSFPVASMRLFTSQVSEEVILNEFAGEPKLVTAPDLEALEQLDIAFLCGAREDGARFLPWAARKGFAAIDLTTAACEAPDVPLVNAGVNLKSIPRGAGIIATPHPVALLLSTLLDPIRRGCGLREAVAVVFEPASHSGEAGIEELYRQTVGVLNFQEAPRDVFGRQLAFNMIPSFIRRAGGPDDTGAPGRIERQVLRVTEGEYRLAVEVVQAPVFHVHAALLRVVLEEGRDGADLAGALGDGREIRVLGEGDPATPVERAGQSGVVVSGIRSAGEAPPAFWLWALFDNLISGAALNAVRIAEALMLRRGARGRS